MKRTAGGKAIAPVVDIIPHVAVGRHDFARIRREMELLRAFGFERVYFVLANPGYPQFSNPWLSLMPPGARCENHVFESVRLLGDPNVAYLHECHRQGMEAWAVLKPYECGGGSTVPHGAHVLFDAGRVETVGGDRIYFDSLLSVRPDLRVLRKPIPDYERLVRQPVTSLEMTFCLEAFEQRTGPATFMQVAAARVPPVPDAELYLSHDNGSYTQYTGSLSLDTRVEERKIVDANGTALFDSPKRCLVLRLSALSVPADVRYLAVTLAGCDDLYTIPHSMISLGGPEGPIPTTASPYVRTPACAAAASRSSAEREWGIEQMPRAHFASVDEAVAAFSRNGFEFEWHGSGFWGNGWKNCRTYGIAKGRLSHMKGTPCEAMPEVREYWQDWVGRCVDMGFDGVDIRLQNHSGMVSDYAAYGYNAPIVERYSERHGIDILKQAADPLEVMGIRGEFFHAFLDQAADIVHSAGRRLQIHLRHAHEEPKLSADFNELGFWAMPKILLDWRRAVDLADEITLKDYFHNNYRPRLAKGIKARAQAQGKPVWIHCYIAQGGELNDEYFSAVEADPAVGGVLLYEVAHSSRNERNSGLIEQYGPVGYHEPNAAKLRAILDRLRYE